MMDDLPPILVVEDEALLRELIVEALEAGGYSVIEAANGNDALAEIERAQQLRGLVTDIRVPGPDGWQIAHRAREKFSSLAVVYVSGDSGVDWCAHGVPLSVMLQKPFAFAELVTALANLVMHQPPDAHT